MRTSKSCSFNLSKKKEIEEKRERERLCVRSGFESGPWEDSERTGDKVPIYSL